MPLARPCGPLAFVRSFSASSSCGSKSSAKRLADEHSAVPPYPYGPSVFYKQSNFGLYGSAKIRYGNKVSPKNEIKTRRPWRPNVQQKRLWSKALDKYLRLRVTARVLRTIDKCGGLDEYLLGDKPARIRELGMGGWKLRWRIVQTESVKERFRKERAALGLPPKQEVAVGPDGTPLTAEQLAAEVSGYDGWLNTDNEIDIGDDVGEEPGKETFMEEQSLPPQQQKSERVAL